MTVLQDKRLPQTNRQLVCNGMEQAFFTNFQVNTAYEPEVFYQKIDRMSQYVKW